MALSCVYQFINFEPGHQDVISDKNLHIVRKELSNYDDVSLNYGVALIQLKSTNLHIVRKELFNYDEDWDVSLNYGLVLIQLRSSQ